MYYTKNLKIEILRNTVKLINYREDGKIYLLEAKRFHQLLKIGGKKWNIPNKNGSYEQISFNLERKHISNAGSEINTYIAQHDYDLLMGDLKASISPTTVVGI